MKTVKNSTWRADFSMLSKTLPNGKPFIYFDSAATAQKPTSVIDTKANFYRYHYSTVHRAVYTLAGAATEAYDQVRKQAQAFLHAKHLEEIIFTRGTTESVNLVA